MTRLELLHLVVGRARTNGFELRRWYTSRLGLPWISGEAALSLLEAQRRYYALIFSHDFAQTFWKPGTEITFDVPPQTFQRSMPDGSVRTVHRKPFIRRSARPNAWKYHLRHMALAEEPLRYLRKYLHIDEDLAPSTEPGDREAARDSTQPALTASQPAPSALAIRRRDTPRPLPTDLPAFLKRPYIPN